MISTNNKENRQLVVYQCPDMVGEYIECGPSTTFDIVQLLTALDPDHTYQHPNHGNIYCYSLQDTLSIK